MILRCIAYCVLVLVCAGCAQQPTAPSAGRVILLPGSDGTAGAVEVELAGRQATLDTGYTSARATVGGALEVTRVDPALVRAEFGAVLDALPPAPLSFIVYFVFGHDELTEESRKALTPILQDVERRPAPEVTVIGHADQAGPERVNDTLALRRAERVRELLVQRGLRTDRITVVGRGSREPAVHAPEGVAEARNRRVEVSVR